MFDYQQFFAEGVSRLHREKRYRRFRALSRQAGMFPAARATDSRAPHSAASKPVTVWCSNDYLGMSQHPVVLEASHRALQQYGAGAGGTRNISGTHDLIVSLEVELADLHRKPAALVFSSGYVANDATLATLAAALPRCVIVSDHDNHASMIEGMRRSRAEIKVFAHNDARSLAAALASIDPARPKIVAFESLYSMSGDIAPLATLLAVARQHGALTYVDETHAVGVHGPRGGGLLETQGLLQQVDVIQGGLGKGFGVVGGFITGSQLLVDFVRSHAAGFIFTTALPPVVAAGALASVRHLKQSNVERAALFARVRSVREQLAALGVPIGSADAQILPWTIGDSTTCQAIADELFDNHGVYLQPINYPTVARGQERLRITPSPLHSDAMQAVLVDALTSVLRSRSRDAA